AIATGRYIFEIPEEVIQFAKDREFIIIELPWEIRFADIVHEVMNKLNELKQSETMRFREVQQQLIQKVLEGRTLKHISGFVEQELSRPVLICNEKRQSIAGSADPDEVFTLWKQVEEKSA